jgi:hypothetical protein
MISRKVRSQILAAAAAGAMMVALAAPPAAAGTFSYTGSLQMTRGDYFFTQTTSGLFFFNGFSFVSRRFSLTASIPLIFQNTPYVSYTGIGVLPSGGTESSAVSQRQGREPVILPEVVDVRQLGLGDPLFMAGLTVVEESPSLPAIQLSGLAKVPLADVEKGFGTGEWDWSAGLSVSKRFGRLFLFADLNYWIMGDLPDLELRNAWAFGISIGHSFGDGRLAVLASYAGCSEVVDGVEPPSSLGLGLSIKLGRLTSLMLQSAFGLSESTPDLSLSLGWSIGFGRR